MTAHSFRDINEALPKLMGYVLGGHPSESRNGTVRERQMVQTTLTHPGNGYLTSKARKASLPAQIAETMWLLAGRNDIEWLSHYLPRAAEFSDDGKTWRGGYGPRIRKWDTHQEGGWVMDQLAHVVQLLQQDPHTRRAVINIYDPAVDSAPGKDVPCNNWVHFIARSGRLNAHVAIRSNDLMWGFSGINHFEWTQLLRIVAGLTGMDVGSITFSASSLHLYEPYWPKAGRIVEEGDQAPAFTGNSPVFTPESNDVRYLDGLIKQWFALEQLIRTGRATSTTPTEMEEPLLRSWLHALYVWHTPGATLPRNLRGTELELALEYSPKQPTVEPAPLPTPFKEGSFAEFASALHREKHAAYGDSWMKRGEQMGIMANIARKVDRLGVAGGGDTSADTAIDMMLYLVKYRLWLMQRVQGGVALEGPEHVAAVDTTLGIYSRRANAAHTPTGRFITECKQGFEELETLVLAGGASPQQTLGVVSQLLRHAYPLAARLWRAEQNSTRSWNPEAGA